MASAERLAAQRAERAKRRAEYDAAEKAAGAARAAADAARAEYGRLDRIAVDAEIAARTALSIIPSGGMAGDDTANSHCGLPLSAKTAAGPPVLTLEQAAKLPAERAKRQAEYDAAEKAAGAARAAADAARAEYDRLDRIAVDAEIAARTALSRAA